MISLFYRILGFIGLLFMNALNIPVILDVKFATFNS